LSWLIVLLQEWALRFHNAEEAVKMQQQQIPGSQACSPSLLKMDLFAEILARVLSARGVRADEARKHLAPSLQELMPDPMKLQGTL
jgi:hypothetical protein